MAAHHEAGDLTGFAVLKRPTLRRVAWHEAGHAVVAWERGLTVTSVSIRPDGEGFGRSQHPPLPRNVSERTLWRWLDGPQNLPRASRMMGRPMMAATFSVC